MINPLYEIYESVRERGVLRTLQIMYAVASDVVFDWRHGTDTHGWVHLAQLNITSENRSRGEWYVPTRARAFRKIMQHVEVPPDSVFLDIGSGKGRMLLMATAYGFAKIRGIEFSPELCGVAEENVHKFRVKRRVETPIEIIETDAEDYTFRDDENVLFMFNPFDEVVMGSVMKALMQSLERRPRSLWVVYHSPHQRHIVEQQGIFQIFSEKQLGGSDFVVYRAIPTT
jgi:SAM-dependent methyltransferase